MGWVKHEGIDHWVADQSMQAYGEYHMLVAEEPGLSVVRRLAGLVRRREPFALVRDGRVLLDYQPEKKMNKPVIEVTDPATGVTHYLDIKTFQKQFGKKNLPSELKHQGTKPKPPSDKEKKAKRKDKEAARKKNR